MSTCFEGMEAVGLKTFLEKHPDAVHILFPTEEDATILDEELKARLIFHDEGLGKKSIP